MQSQQPRVEPRIRSDRVPAMVVAAILVTAMVALVALVWYPTTQQPAITLTDAKFVPTASCVLINGWYGNQYDWSFTLVNSGTADGYASAEFFLDGNPMGYVPFLIGQHTQATETGSTIGNLYRTTAECGVPETLTVSLASVTRSPAIDERTLIQVTVSPLSTLILVGLMLGILNLLAHRRGLSIFKDLGAAGWRPAFLTVFAALLLSGVVTFIFTTPYNYPLDWTPAIVYGAVVGSIGVAIFIVACRAVLAGGGRDRILGF